MNEEQYRIVADRRISQNDLLWQTPVLAVTAQSFLLAAAFDLRAAKSSATILFIFSLVVGLASIQLMAKHRFLERFDSELLARFEREHEKLGYSVIHGRNGVTTTVPRNFLARMVSFHIWLGVLCGFSLLAIYGLYSILCSSG